MKLEKIKKLLTPPVAAVVIAGGLCFTAVAIWAPPETREWLFGANGLLWTVASLLLRLNAASEEGGK